MFRVVEAVTVAASTTVELADAIPPATELARDRVAERYPKLVCTIAQVDVVRGPHPCEGVVTVLVEVDLPPAPPTEYRWAVPVGGSAGPGVVWTVPAGGDPVPLPIGPTVTR